MNYAADVMFELELEMLDKQIGDLELERGGATRARDHDALGRIDEQLERLWEEVRRFSRLEARLDLADPGERSRIVGLAN